MFPHLPHLLLFYTTLFNNPALAHPRSTPPQNDLRIPELSVTLGGSENPQSDLVIYASESSRFTNEPDTIQLDREGTEYGFYFSCVDVAGSGLGGKVKNVKMRVVTQGECRFYVSHDCTRNYHAPTSDWMILRQADGKPGVMYEINVDVARDAEGTELDEKGIGSFLCAGEGDRIPGPVGA